MGGAGMGGAGGGMRQMMAMMRPAGAGVAAAAP
jgi:hypothetical protein